MVKVVGAKLFDGVITGISELSPEYGGKPYRLEVTLTDGSKAYIVDDEDYDDMGFPKNFSPYKPGAWEEMAVERKCMGEYWECDGKKIIVSFKFYGD